MGRDCEECGAQIPYTNDDYLCEACSMGITKDWREWSVKIVENEKLLNKIYERLDNLDKEMVRRNIGWTKLRLRKWILEEIRNLKHDIKRSL